MTSSEIENKLIKLINPAKAHFFGKFFKTGEGQYGHGDQFIGVSVPEIREVAKKYQELPLSEIEKLLKSKIHEYRLCGLLMLTYKFPKASEKEKQEIYEFYLQNKQRANNWDLVDLSAYKIVGAYLLNHEEKFQEIKSLAKSPHLWSRRIAMISMLALIREKKFQQPLEIIEILISDQHDLMHKAVGWMLRELGKRDENELKKFLDEQAATMPRTALRYAIERMDQQTRHHYMNLKNRKLN